MKTPDEYEKEIAALYDENERLKKDAASLAEKLHQEIEGNNPLRAENARLREDLELKRIDNESTSRVSMAHQVKVMELEDEVKRLREELIEQTNTTISGLNRLTELRKEVKALRAVVEAANELIPDLELEGIHPFKLKAALEKVEVNK